MATKYFIIKVPINTQENHSIVEFDTNKYERENNINLIGDPLSMSVENDHLILIFKGTQKSSLPPNRIIRS